MSKAMFAMRAELHPEITVQLTENQARALAFLASFSHLDVLAHLQNVSGHFRSDQIYGKAVLGLLDAARDQLPNIIKSIDRAHDALEGKL